MLEKRIWHGDEQAAVRGRRVWRSHAATDRSTKPLSLSRFLVTVETRSELESFLEPSDSNSSRWLSSIHHHGHLSRNGKTSTALMSIVDRNIVLLKIFWCSKQRRSKSQSTSSNLSIRATNAGQIEKLKEIPLFVLMTERIQPLDEDRSSSSSSPLSTKKFRQKNLLER